MLERIAKKLGIETKRTLIERLNGLESIHNNLICEKEDLLSKLMVLQDELGKAYQEVKDTEYLAEMILKDKVIVENELRKLNISSKNYEKPADKFFKLPDCEKKILLKYLPGRVSSKPVNDKIHDRVNHSDPKGYETFLNKLAQCNYIDGVWGLRHIYKSFKRICFNRIYKENGVFVLEGVYVLNNFGKIFKAHTTARNEMEANYIKDLLNDKF